MHGIADAVTVVRHVRRKSMVTLPLLQDYHEIVVRYFGNSLIPLDGPDRTRPDKVRGLCRRPGSAARVSRKIPCGSVRVRAGPVGSGRARVVEFSVKWVAWRGS